jgi:hypothetical protein
MANLGGGALTQDHNTYCDVGTITDTGAGLQALATCALLNSPEHDDFALVSDTSAWTPLSSPFNMDIVGNVRTSSRGAFQFCDGGCGQADGGTRDAGLGDGGRDGDFTGGDAGDAALRPGEDGGHGRDAGSGAEPGSGGGSSGCGCHAAGSHGEGLGALWGVGLAALMAARPRRAHHPSAEGSRADLG